MASVLRLVEYAQRFFSVKSVDNILSEFLPHFTTHSIPETISSQGYLVLFLPVEQQVESYLPTVFSLWSTFTLSSVYDTQFTYLVARIAELNVNKGHSDVGLFTKQQVKSVFTTGLRMMNLPVGSRSDGSYSGSGAAGGASTGYGSAGLRIDAKAGSSLLLRKKAEKFKSLAQFIVYTIMADQGSKSYSLSLLSDMIQAIELYYHPSNHGTWSYFLTSFARHLAAEFLKRWREEEEPDCETAKERRLTPEFRRELVLILRPVTYLSMFGKDQYTVGASQSTLKYLSWLEPSLIFPGLLERIYPSLETLTETHRTSSALSILADISLPLFSRDHYPAGAKHLLPLLHLAIPGIDLNDPIKTIASLMFISTSLMSIPIFDLTRYTSPDHSLSDHIDLEDPAAQLPRTTEDYLAQCTTAQFEEWLAKFLRRVFTIFDNLPQENRKKQSGSTMEAGLTQMLLHACDIVFGQLSDELYDMALRSVVDFVSDRVLPNAVRAAGLLCDTITSANPKKAGKILIPLCITHIQTELEHGAASTVSHSASSNIVQSDSTFHWYQNILLSVVSAMGAEVLVYQKEIISITEMMIQHCRSRRGIMWTGKLIRSTLNTVLNVYPKDFKSLNPSVWNDRQFMTTQSHQVWGQPGDPAQLEIQWHTPSEAEKQFALDYLSRFLTLCMDRLHALMNETSTSQSSHDLNNELCRHLAILRNCLMGSATMVGDDGVTADIMEEDEDEGEVRLIRALEVGYAFTDPADPRTQQARQIRKSMGELIHQLFTFFRTKREDDVENVKILIKIARTYLCERGVEKSQFDRSKNGYSYAKNIGRTPLCKKRYPRNLLVRRAYNHHLLRLRQNVQGRLRTPLYDSILSDLLAMSLGSYAEIRKVSQIALAATARCFRGSKQLIVPVLIEALQPSDSSDRMKGALYLFTHRSILHPCLRDWRFIPDFVISLCSAQHQDKLTIQELIRKVFLEYISQFNSFSFRVLCDDSQVDRWIQPISPTVTSSDFHAQVRAIQSKVEARSKKQITAYYQLIESLLGFSTNNRIHWRFATMAANFIEVFLRSDAKPSDSLALFANNAILSELPTMRRIGVSATIQLLLYIKQRSFVRGDEDKLIRQEVRNPLKVKVNDQNLLTQSYQPLDAQKSILVDDATVGWYVWPKTYDGYKVNTKDSLFDTIDPGSLGAYKVFEAKFTSPGYWEQLCSFFSEELNQKQDDRFSSSHARLFTSIFQTFVDLPLKAAKPFIEALVEASDQKSSQRAAAEILGGLIRGTKHWNIQKLKSVWEWLTPLLNTAFTGITPDSLTYWESCIRYMATKRDPRRIQPLIDIIIKAEMDPTSDAAFTESRKLLLVRALIVSIQWKFQPYNAQLLPIYFDHLQHPYKQFREVIGGNINELLQIEWIPAYPSVEVLLKQNAVSDGVGNVPNELTPTQAIQVNHILHKLDVWRQDVHGLTASSDYAHASKSILCWLHDALSQWRVAGTLPYVIPFLHKVFYMQDINDDQDLQMMATKVLSLMAQINYPPHMIPKLIDQFLMILTTSSSWHTRIRALPVLQIFFFKHLFMMTSQELIRIMEVISQMLLDSQIEVRQLASVTLGGLVRCSQREAIQSLLDQYSIKTKTKIPRRKRDRVTGKNVEPAGFAEAVLQKHAGVLGISCLINAFPYEVPEWMPPILCELADCISDPAAEIQSTIRKTFSDFRRTHSDTWHEDMLKFNEDQLSILNDMLISPSYYA
ncbi:hypothetical protein BDB01DRAFT_842338 [Pilobolus umbonatus]|nr:hypothetical protein BDB01DRAFT_842338 [Pilobolus umbonatus]